jgi:uncharacterized protein YndB with AHSA1/START domain
MHDDPENPYEVSVSRTIPATPEEIFDILSDTEGHVAIDGSGTVKDAVGAQRLEMGSKFGMKMRMGVPYRIKNTVVEYEPNRLIAWQHFGKHRWRYRLEPVDDGTLVTESFDWSRSLSRKGIELMGYPEKHPAGMAKTLERLEAEVLRRRSSE